MKSRIEVLYRIGGIELVLHKIFDRVFRRATCNDVIYKKCAKASPKDYPRLLSDLYEYKLCRKLNLDNPRYYTEKIQWIKLYDLSEKKTRLADKYLVRKWIEDTISADILIPLLGVWDDSNEIDFDSLPNKFVLKCNHGSGWNIVIKDKTKINYGEVRSQLNKWLHLNFAYCAGLEMQYAQIKPKIIAETYMEQLDRDLIDYKIHCFNGNPRIVQLIGERDLKSHRAKECFLDLNWNRTDNMCHTYDQYEMVPQKPINFNEMVEIAKRLSEGFIYVRVDLYNINGKILFSEMTFTPASGFHEFSSLDIDRYVGDMIEVK